MKEKLCEKVVEFWGESDRVMAVVLALDEEDIGVTCAYASQVGRSEREKDQFCNDMASEWDLQNPSEVVLGVEDFNGHVLRLWF